MGCSNNYAGGTNYACACADGCGSYNVESHGDLGATYNAMTNADLPSYAHGFYFPSKNEQFSDVKYSKLEIGYEKDLREIHQAIQGLPIEAYIPQGTEIVVGGGSPVVHIPEVVSKERLPENMQAAKDEIERAQREVLTSQEKIIREIQIEELILRRIRARVVEEKDTVQRKIR